MMTPKRSQKIDTFNVRGLKGKENLISEWIQQKQLSIVALTEARITNPDEVDRMISEYTALLSTYSNGKGYGGVAICIDPFLK